MGESTSIAILDRFTDVEPYLLTALAAADTDKNALGFIRRGVFEELARKEGLLVAIKTTAGRAEYAGHVLFDARLPSATVLQIFVDKDMRKNRVGAMLMTRLKDNLTALSFTSIYASVAEDLVEANAFWQRQGFLVQRARAGGKSRGRTILVRCHELDSPQLFAKSGISAINPLGLDVGLQGERPIYLLDLNVLFDLGPRRERHAPTHDLFRAERHGTFQLAVSTELRDELQRNARAAPRSDPMQALASIFIAFPVPEAAEAQQLLGELAAVVFGQRGSDGQLSANDRSDLRHLATAIHHRLTGFITNDASILEAAGQLGARFGLRVVSTMAFQETEDGGMGDGTFETSAAETLSLATATIADEGAVRAALVKFGVPDREALTTWSAIDAGTRAFSRWVVRCRDIVVGYLVCSRPGLGLALTARIAVDESHAMSRQVALILLKALLAYSRDGGPQQIRLELPQRQAPVREVAASFGFARSDDGNLLSKVALHRIVVAETWDECRKALVKVCGLRLPDHAPVLKDVEQQLELHRADGNRIYISWADLESHLSPALFCVSNRRAVITPIQRRYAEHLLSHSAQGTFLPRPRASTYAEKHYVSSDRTLRHFRRGTIILFYESGRDRGAMAIVAVARVQRAYLKSSNAIDRDDLDPSVLDAETIRSIGSSKTKTVTVFDNLMLLPRHVPLTTLKRLGCGEATQLFSTRPITNDQLCAILREGLRYE